MKQSWLKRTVLVLALLGVIFASFGAVVPVFAQDGGGATPAAPDNGNPNPNQATPAIPNTGGGDVNTGNNGFFLSGWTLLIILGVVIVILLIALLARSGSTGV